MKRKITLSLCALMTAGALWGANGYHVQVTPVVGKNFSDSSSKMFNSDAMYGIRATYFPVPLYGWQIGYERADDIAYEGTQTTTSLQRLYLNLVVDGEEEMHITPYLLLGGGYEDLGTNIEGEPDQSFVQAGIGFRYGLNRYLNLMIEGRALYKFKMEDIDYVANAGLGVMLGHPTPPKPLMTEAPAPAPMPKARSEAASGAKTAPKAAKLVVVHDHKAELIPMPSAQKVVEEIEHAQKSPQPIHSKSYRVEVHFPFNSAKIMPAYRNDLKKLVAVMKRKPKVKLIVEGHTDSIGTYAYNQKLSQKRANAVKAYLIHHGISASRIKAIGYGERRPIATNMYKDGRAKNRRVVAKFLF